MSILATGVGLVSRNWARIPGWLKWGAGATAATTAVIGGTQVGGSIIKDVAKTPVEGAAEVASAGGVQQTKSNFFGMLNFLAEILKACGVKGGIPEAIAKFANRGHMLGGGNPLQDEKRWAADDQKYGGPGLGNDHTGGDGVSITDASWGKAMNGALKVGEYGLYAGGAYGLYRGGKAIFNNATVPGMKGEPNILSKLKGVDGSKINTDGLSLADDAEKVASKGGSIFSKIGDSVKSGLSKIPRVGKIFGVGAVVGGVALTASGDAEAAPVSTPTVTPSTVSAGTTVAAGIGPLHTVAAEVGGVGLSIVGARAAAGVVASGVAAVAPSIATAIPGVASIYAAGETIYNVGSNALKGEWKKAGLNLVSGIGETVAGIGGAATYLTMGTVWREAVRAGGAKLLGEENTIEHSTVVQAGSWLKDKFSNAATAPENAPTTAQALIYKDKGPAFAF